MADAYVRTATAADAPAIGHIQSVAWRAAYGGVLPTEVLRELTPEAAEAGWTSALSDPPTARHRVLLAREGTDSVGFASLEPGEEGSASAAIGILVVDPRWGRRGHGSRLLAATTDTLGRWSVELVTTWVLESDDVTGSFLESAGWASDGTVRVLDAGGTPLRQFRMHARLEDRT